MNLVASWLAARAIHPPGECVRFDPTPFGHRGRLPRRPCSRHGETKNEVAVEVDLGIAYRVPGGFAAGLELRQVNGLEEGSELESATRFGGPSFSYTGGKWWSALTFTLQLGALVGASDGDFRDLEHQEKVQVRLLMGFHL